MRRSWLAGLVTAGLLVISSAQARSGGGAELAADDLRAPARLEDTGLYEPGRPGVVDARNRPFSPQYPLWSDGAAKARWVFLPPGATIDTSDPGDWDLPVGTRFWKEFRFGGRRIETRLLWKASPARWVVASYIWNAEGTEAVLAPDAGVPAVVEVAPRRWHAIPSAQECLACHGTRPTRPLGFNALQLSTDRDPGAIHAEPLVAGMLTLQTLVDERRLTSVPDWLVADPPRIRANDPLTRSVLGYLSTNCGSCHDGRGEISVVGPSLRHGDVMDDGDEVARRLVGHPTSFQVPGVPAGASVLVDAHSPDLSAMLVRMRSRRPSSQMPPLGTVLPDEAAVDALARWIATVGTRQAVATRSP